MFPELSYKEIDQVKNYDMESLIGNIGGYIGLFLGYSITAIPFMVQKGYRKFFDRNHRSTEEMAEANGQ